MTRPGISRSLGQKATKSDWGRGWAYIFSKPTVLYKHPRTFYQPKIDITNGQGISKGSPTFYCEALRYLVNPVDVNNENFNAKTLKGFSDSPRRRFFAQ